MNVVLDKKKSGLGPLSFVLLSLFLLSAGFSAASYEKPVFWSAMALCGFSLVMLVIVLQQREILIQIDDIGIYDRRLGLGKVRWSDIVSVQLQVAEGNYFLSFRLRNPSPYLANLQGPQRERVMFHQKLGFKGFNVDVAALNVDLVELKRQIDLRIAR